MQTNKTSIQVYFEENPWRKKEFPQSIYPYMLLLSWSYAKKDEAIKNQVRDILESRKYLSEGETKYFVFLTTTHAKKCLEEILHVVQPYIWSENEQYFENKLQELG